MNKINVRDVIATEDFELMQAYINAYAKTDRSEDEAPVGIADILDKEWATAKYNLYKLFGENLILSKTVEYSRSDDEISEEIYLMRENREGAMHKFLHNYFQRMDEIKEKVYHDGWTYSNVLRLFYDYCMSDENFATNRCNTVLELPLCNDKTIKVLYETKVMKVLKELADAYGIEGFEEFRIEHSRVFNGAKMKGQLCLSIHPLDYITMSENDNKWQSCMNWHQNGCYRRGTVEMMNSPTVVVAYLTSKNDMERFGHTWNNKKWRQLIVVEEDIISSVKSYPYQHDGIAAIAVQWLADLKGEAFKDQPVHTCYYDGELFIEGSGNPLRASFSTEAMYNDFGTDVHHMTVVSQCYDSDSWEVYNYSGRGQCMYCGDYMMDRDDDCPAQYLVCGKCGSPTVRCDCCGSFRYEDELVNLNGEYYCEYCYDRNTSVDLITGVRMANRDMREVYISYGEAAHQWQWRYYRIGSVDRNLINSDAWLDRYPPIRYTDNSIAPWSVSWCFIDWKECNEETRARLETWFREEINADNTLEACLKRDI